MNVLLAEKVVVYLSHLYDELPNSEFCNQEVIAAYGQTTVQAQLISQKIVGLDIPRAALRMDGQIAKVHEVGQRIGGQYFLKDEVAVVFNHRKVSPAVQMF